MAVLRGGRFTGGNFRPTQQQVAEDAQAAATSSASAPQPATIAPSGRGGLPTQQLAERVTTPAAQPTSSPQSAQPQQSIVDLADQVLGSGTASTSPSAPARPRVFGGGVNIDQETAGVDLDLADGLTTNLQSRTREQQVQGRTGQRSPERADVVTQPVPIAGAIIGGDTQQFETPAEVNARYEAEQLRQRENIKGADRLAKAAQTNLADSDATAFESASYKIAEDISVFASEDPSSKAALESAGLIKDGIADMNASRTLFYLLSKTVAEKKVARDSNASTISKMLADGEISEADIDNEFYKAQNTDHYLRPEDFSGKVGKELATMLNIDNAVDADSRISDPNALKQQGEGRERSIISAITPKLLENIGAINAKEILDADGKPETVYEIDPEFEFLADRAASQLSEFSPQFARDVTFTPNRGGVPSGVAGIAHKETTKSPTSKTGVVKGSEVWKALDAMGTTPNGVDSTHLKGLLSMLNDIKARRDADVKRDNLMGAFSFSDHPMAETFKLGKTTWMKAFKIARDNYTEQLRYDADSRGEVSRFRELQFITELDSNTSGTGIGATTVGGITYATGLMQVYQNANNQIAQGIQVERNQGLLSELQNIIRSANYQQGILAQSDLKALKDGARLNGKTFYHTYTPHAATSRPMVSSTKFNPQASKVARGLHANPRVAVVELRAGKPDNNVATAWKAIVARSLAENAERAPSIKALAKTFSELEKSEQYGAVRQAAKDYYLGQQGNRVDIKSLATNFNAAVDEQQGSAKVLLPNDPNYIDTGLTMGLDTEQTKNLAHVLETSKNGVQVKSDEVHLKMKALYDFGKYLHASNGGKNDVIIQTQISAEADGISNGLIIQARQFGNEEVLRKGGVLYTYDSEGNEIGLESILPEGDMREHIHTALTNESMGKVFPNEAERKLWQSAYDIMFKPGGKLDTSRMKALHKVPVMTTPYGLDPKFHGNSIADFASLPDMEADVNKAIDVVGVSREEFLKTMTELEGSALTIGLGAIVKHQAVVKNATNAAIAAGKLFIVKGANGWPVVSGGFVREETSYGTVRIGGQEVELTGGNTYGSSLAMKEYQQSKKSALELIEEYDNSSKSETTAKSSLMAEIKKSEELGTATRNQSAVAGTQNIDATIVQEGFLSSKEKVGNDFWGMQIFDAVIGDVHSYATMVDTMNDKFDSVNRNYSMVDAEIDAIRDIRQEVLKDVKIAKQNNLKFDVSPNGAYAGMYNVIEKLVVKKWRAHEKGVAIGKPQKGAKQALTRVLTSPKFGWKQGGSNMTPAQFLATYDFVLKELEINDSLKRLKAEVDRGRAQASSATAKQAERGNRTRQYS